MVDRDVLLEQYRTEHFPLGPDIIVFAPNESTVAPHRQFRGNGAA
jgi:hypothetical protein